jgi:TPR repeat protein
VLSFQRAALERDGEGMFLLGRAYLTGHGVEEDVVRGARWYREACKAGYVSSSSYGMHVSSSAYDMLIPRGV